MHCIQLNAWYKRAILAIESEEIGNDDLYIILAGKYYKIGRTRNFHTRMRVFQTACPYRIKCLILLRGKGFTEKLIHTALGDFILRQNGEWFKDSDLLQKLLVEIKPYSKPYRELLPKLGHNK